MPPFAAQAYVSAIGGPVNPATLDEALTVWRGEGPLFSFIQILSEEHRETARWMEQNFTFHDLAIEDALSVNERPSVMSEDDWLFVTVPVPIGTRFVETSLFLGHHGLVSVSIEPIPLLDQIVQRWFKHPDEVGYCPADLLHSILDECIDLFFPELDRIQEDVGDIEEAIFSSTKTDPTAPLQVKRRLLEMRRALSPLRDELNVLLRRDILLIPEKVRPYIQDIYDHSLRLIETIDLQRDVISTVLDAQMNIASNRLSEVMKFLTVLSTVLMSIGLVAGIYGMNFASMPELNQPWGYPAALGLMLTIAITEIIFFRRKGWL